MHFMNIYLLKNILNMITILNILDNIYLVKINKFLLYVLTIYNIIHIKIPETPIR